LAAGLTCRFIFIGVIHSYCKSIRLQALLLLFYPIFAPIDCFLFVQSVFT